MCVCLLLHRLPGKPKKKKTVKITGIIVMGSIEMPELDDMNEFWSSVRAAKAFNQWTIYPVSDELLLYVI